MWVNWLKREERQAGTFSYQAGTPQNPIGHLLSTACFASPSPQAIAKGISISLGFATEEGLNLSNLLGHPELTRGNLKLYSKGNLSGRSAG